MKVLNSWLLNRKSDIDILTTCDEELNEVMTFFVAEVRNKDGKEYMPNTIYELVIAVQHHLRQNGRLINFLDDNGFDGMRKVLDGKMKSLSRQSIGATKKKA